MGALVHVNGAKSIISRMFLELAHALTSPLVFLCIDRSLGVRGAFITSVRSADASTRCDPAMGAGATQGRGWRKAGLGRQEDEMQIFKHLGRITDPHPDSHANRLQAPLLSGRFQWFGAALNARVSAW